MVNNAWPVFPTGQAHFSTPPSERKTTMMMIPARRQAPPDLPVSTAARLTVGASAVTCARVLEGADQ